MEEVDHVEEQNELEGFDEEKFVQETEEGKIVEAHVKGIKEACDKLKEVRDTALYLASYLKLQREKDRFIKLRQELEEDEVAYNHIVRQKKTQEALRLMSTKAKMLNGEHPRVQEEVLRLQAELVGLVKTRTRSKYATIVN
ncbi:uncharacterized protein [Coffea arabica]|uniref:Uncharacterized protein n=1 Tax=Coffea arabica TaxID=13443 RepID=A0ABM4VPT7_COFAR